jgi:hypothetical protein
MRTDYLWLVCRAAGGLDLVECIGPLVNRAAGPLYTLRGISRVYTLEGMGQKFFGRFSGSDRHFRGCPRCPTLSHVLPGGMGRAF